MEKKTWIMRYTSSCGGDCASAWVTASDKTEAIYEALSEIDDLRGSKDIIMIYEDR